MLRTENSSGVFCGAPILKNYRQPFLDFFAGSGLVTEGLKFSFKPVWANDICEKKAAVFTANHPDEKFVRAPIQKINGADLPEAVLSWASFPCQDLSLAGNQKGITSARSGLVWEWLRVMDEMPKTPPLIVAENVVGLISGAKGANYRRLHEALVERGYKVGVVLINAAHWVPQSRPRVFIVGVTRSLNVGSYAGNGPNWAHSTAIVNAARGLDHWVWWSLPEPVATKPGLEKIVDWGAPCDPLEKSKHILGLIPEKHRSKMEFSARLGMKVFPGYRRIRNGKQVLELRFDGLAGCLRTPNGGSSRQVLVFKKDGRFCTRLLTVRETARLMGVRDSYQLPGSYNDGYWAMGDAVAVPSVKFLANYLLEPLANSVLSKDGT